MINTSTDIYEIASDVQKLQKKYIDEDQEVLNIGMYGYFADQFSTIIQNNIMMTSQWVDEAFPTRAKFEKTILSNAISCNISDLHAKPSRMDVKIGVIKSELDSVFNSLGSDRYEISRDTKISVDEFTFRLEYDLTILRQKRYNGEYIYFAINTLNGQHVQESTYLPAPIVMDYSGDNYILFDTTLLQMECSKISRKMINKNVFDNKCVDFTFTNQLYKFDVKVVEPDGTTVSVKPLFEGENEFATKFCNYYFVTPNTIRVKFDSRSYMPGVNSEVFIDVYTTEGDKGNMLFDVELLFTSSYKNKILHGVVLPTDKAYGGYDRKTINDLKRIIPKERLSRGILSNERDLENYFNMVDTNSRLKFFKKRHNQFERCYYSYLLVKDTRNNVIPTNTVDVTLTNKEFFTETKHAFIIQPNTLFIQQPSSRLCLPAVDVKMKDIQTLEQSGFLYTNPFIVNVNKAPLYVSYFLNVLNDNYNFNYRYINMNSDVQFMTSKLNVYKNHVYDNFHYYLNFSILSNTGDGVMRFENDEEGHEKGFQRLYPVLVLRKGEFEYYVEGEIEYMNNETMDENRDSTIVKFKVGTSNVINEGIELREVFQYGTKTEVSVEMPEDISCEIQLYVKPLPNDVITDTMQYDRPNDDYKDKVLISVIEPREKVKLFHDYTDIINSVATVSNSYDLDLTNFTIDSMPVVKYSYMQDIDRCNEFVNYIHHRKKFIDRALLYLDNNFTIDFKFFNTYGYSNAFLVGRTENTLDRVNINLDFVFRAKPGANIAIKELLVDATREFIENINTIKSIHISNLITYLEDRFSSDVEFIEFTNLNQYGAKYQYLEKVDDIPVNQVPEFININLKENLEPDISFTLV